MSKENLCKKHGVTKKELKSGVYILTHYAEKINNVSVSIALTDLLNNGDIKPFSTRASARKGADL